MSVVRVDPECVLGEVSPLLYGMFTENIAHVVYDGIWAEMLYGRKFESPMASPLPAEIAAPWRGIGAQADGVSFMRTPAPRGRMAHPHLHAHHVQAVLVGGDHPGGLAHDALRVDEAVTYQFRARARSHGDAGPLRVALVAPGGRVLAESIIDGSRIERLDPAMPLMVLFGHPTAWSEVSCDLVPSASAPEATLELTVPRGAVAFDWVSLMPSGHLDGLDAGIVSALRDAHVPLLKWPGGCFADGYDWRLGIGPRDSRYAAMDQAWCAWDENDYGTEEFLHLCELIGAEPFLCANAGNGTADEAAAWVDHVKGRVRRWCVGNELWAFHEIGFVGADGYAKRYLEFARAMREADPSISLTAVGDVGAFNRTVLGAARDQIDLLSIHFYTPDLPHGDATAKIRSALGYDELLARVRSDLEATGAPDMPVAFDEWGFSGPGHVGAIYDAAVLNVFHRSAPLVALGARTTAVNAGGIVAREGTVVRREPSWETFRLYTEAHRPNAVACSSDDEALDVSALADGQGGVSVYIVNTGPHPVDAKLDGTGGHVTRTDTVAPGPAGPFGASTVTSADDFDGVLPPHSLTVLRTS